MNATEKVRPLRFRYRQVSMHTEMDPEKEGGRKQTAFDSEQESVTRAV